MESKKIKSIFFGLIMGYSACSLAQGECPPKLEIPSHEQLKQARETAKDRGFLWEISKDDKTSYLYGTIHVGNFDWVTPGPQLVDALRKSNKLALELNLSDALVLKELIDLISTKEDSKLSIEQNLRIQNFAQKSCIELATYQHLRPEFQLATLQLATLRKDKIYPELGIDIVLSGMASALKKTIIGIETPLEQISAIISKPEELAQDVNDVLEKLENDSEREILTKLVKVWVDKDFETLNKYAEWCKCLDTQKEREKMNRLLGDRNIVMVDRFNKIHAVEGRVFMAVGALHMVGPMGIPAVLKNQGYSVIQIH